MAKSYFLSKAFWNARKSFPLCGWYGLLGFQPDLWHTHLCASEVCYKLHPIRPEGAEALSPGHRPGYKCMQLTPCKGKSILHRADFYAFAPSGRSHSSIFTQGVTLGYELLPLRGIGLTAWKIFNDGMMRWRHSGTLEKKLSSWEKRFSQLEKWNWSFYSCGRLLIRRASKSYSLPCMWSHFR